MSLFKNGGTCATQINLIALQLAQYKRRKATKAMRKQIEQDDKLAKQQRMDDARMQVIRELGTDYICHPLNTSAKWGHGNVHK